MWKKIMFEDQMDVKQLLDCAVTQYEFAANTKKQKAAGAAVKIRYLDDKSSIIFESSNLTGNPIAEIAGIFKAGESLSRAFEIEAIGVATTNKKIDIRIMEDINSLIEGQEKRPSLYQTFRGKGKLWQVREFAPIF